MADAIAGHILNPAATGAGAAPPEHPGVMARAPEGFDALDTALAEMRAAGITRLAIEGGDGTVREVLTRLPDHWGEALPTLGIIARGNTNLIARSAGQMARGDLPAFTEASGWTRRSLPILEAKRTDAPPLSGFILGVGAYETATRMAREKIAARHGPQILLALWQLIRDPALRAPTRIGFSADGDDGDAPPAPRLLVGVSTLPGALLYRLQPFWGGGEGLLRWLDIDADPPRLPAALPYLAFGRPRPWMRSAYRSGRAHAITLRIETPFVMDGETFAPPEDGLVHLAAPRTATFLSPR